MTTLYERLTEEIEQRAISAYQDDSMLGDFIPVEVGDISIEKWFHKYLEDLPEAALTRAGFNPNIATLDASEFGHYLRTVSEEIQLGEKDWKFFEKHGLATAGIEMLGEKIGIGATRYLWQGKDANGLNADGPVDYNWIADAGAGVGSSTKARPLIITGASAGAWSTYANKTTDLTNIIARLEAKNFNLSTTTIYYPKVASGAMRIEGEATKNFNAFEYLMRQGVMDVKAVPNQYMLTAAGATPTAAAFDLYAIDRSQVRIGYTRPEKVQTKDLRAIDRTVHVEGEVWFVPYFRPLFVDDDFYKGISRITAINGS